MKKFECFFFENKLVGGKVLNILKIKKNGARKNGVTKIFTNYLYHQLLR
jgi:hypothetical protein